MQPAADHLAAPDWAGLLAETRAALAYLRADELDALASRAEEMLLACADLSPQPSRISKPCEGVRREHRLLGDLLDATGDNLRVLRRDYGNAEGNARWAR